jgi:hypothetical protein
MSQDDFDIPPSLFYIIEYHAITYDESGHDLVTVLSNVLKSELTKGRENSVIGRVKPST